MASRENARRFHFLREIASGGFGTVYLCKVVHPDGFSRLAAVKILKAQWTDSDEVVRRIRDEARLLGLLRHRNIITVSDLTSIDGRAAVVMEYVEGVDLRAIVRHLGDAGRPPPARAALEIVAAVAGALDAAYNRPPLPGEKPLRVIHRDIKPSNVMVERQGEVKVLDFGVARSDLADRESHTEELQFGSVDYMAPERLFFEPETPAGDIYGLGATLYELLALEKLGKARGRPDQHAASVEDRISYLRAVAAVRGPAANELADLVRAAVAFEHERRPSAAELQQRCRALARLVDGEELQAWAEREVPALLDAIAHTPAHAGGLTDTVRTEDSISRGFDEGGAAVEVPAANIGQRLAAAALRELEDSSAGLRPIAASPARGAPSPVPDPAAPPRAAVTLAPPVLDEDAGDEWTERPTYVGPHLDPTALPEPADEALAPARALPQSVPPRPIWPGPAAGDAPGGGPPPFTPPALAPASPGLSPPTGAPPKPIPAFVEPALADEGAPTTVDADDHTTGRIDPLPPAPPAPRPAAAPTRGASRVAIVVGGMLGGCLLLVVASSGLAGAAWWWSRRQAAVPTLPALEVADPTAALAEALQEAAEPPPAEAPPVEPPPAEAPPVATPTAATPSAAPAAGMAFSSLAEGTRKLSARCTGGEATGAGEVQVELPAADRCVVTAILEDRSRLVAVVEQATAGRYACFAGGEARCERK